jgi:hypothetical protein
MIFSGLLGRVAEAASGAGEAILSSRKQSIQRSL